MDDDLYWKMRGHYFQDYLAEARSRRSGFWQGVDQIFAAATQCMTGGSEMVAMLGFIGGICAIALLPFSVAAGGFLVLTGVTVACAVSDGINESRAGKALDQDIASGTIPEKYAPVLESEYATICNDPAHRLSHYKADLERWREQLPLNGTISRSFKDAATFEQEVPAPPAHSGRKPGGLSL